MTGTASPATRDDGPVHLPQLDGWRGIAILLVLLAHFGAVHPAGLLGVQLFFVLSGLLMVRLLFERRMSLPTFYRRRVARIVPAFLFYLATMAVVTALFDMPDTPSRSMVWSALFLRTYLPGADIWADPLVGHIWSLNVEEHGYVVMSMLALAMASRPRASMLALALVALACVAAFALHRAHPHWAPQGSSGAVLRTEVAAFAIFASAALRLALLQARRMANRATFVAALATLLLLVLVSGWVHPAVGGNLLRHFIVPLAMAVVVNLLAIETATPPGVTRALSHPVLVWFGLISYSLYLWHYPLWRLMPQPAPAWMLALACALSIAVAVLSYYALERPMRRWINGPAAAATRY